MGAGLNMVTDKHYDKHYDNCTIVLGERLVIMMM